jgi:hypothetical protein
MNTFMLIASILQAIAMVARNPELGVESNGARYAELIDFLARLVQRGNEAMADLQKLRTEVEAIIARGSPPTDDEIASWRARSDAAHAALQAMATQVPGPDAG